MTTPAPTHGFGDSVLADEYDDAIADSTYIKTDPNGDLWTIQPLQPHPAGRPLFTGHSLICVEQYNGPGEIACYQPVCLASSEIEAITLISQDYLHRSAEAGDLCPEGYALWTRDPNGHYRRTAEISKA